MHFKAITVSLPSSCGERFDFVETTTHKIEGYSIEIGTRFSQTGDTSSALWRCNISPGGDAGCIIYRQLTRRRLHPGHARGEKLMWTLIALFT